MSSAHELELRDGKKYQTGYYLNEFVIPYRKLIEAGYEPVIANPNGDQPVMDANSNNAAVRQATRESFVAVFWLIALPPPPTFPCKCTCLVVVDPDASRDPRERLKNREEQSDEKYKSVEADQTDQAR